jgi:hypothetical protein
LASYYYLVSSLPALRTDKKPPFTEAEFMQLCARQLSDRDFSLLESLRDGEQPAGRNTAVDRWNEFETSFSRELAFQRAERMQIHDKEKYERTGYIPANVRETIKKAVTADSPLDAEHMLLHMQFSFLDEISVNHYFDLTAVLVYYIKLRMIIRSSYFDYELGDQEFKRLLSNIKTSIKSV